MVVSHQSAVCYCMYYYGTILVCMHANSNVSGKVWHINSYNTVSASRSGLLLQESSCNGGKNAAPRTPFAAYCAISVRIMIHTYILVKNSHRIQNQHLQFTLELSNDSQVTRTFAETTSGEYSSGATNAIVISEKLRPVYLLSHNY